MLKYHLPIPAVCSNSKCHCCGRALLPWVPCVIASSWLGCARTAYPPGVAWRGHRGLLCTRVFTPLLAHLLGYGLRMSSAGTVVKLGAAMGPPLPFKICIVLLIAAAAGACKERWRCYVGSRCGKAPFPTGNLGALPARPVASTTMASAKLPSPGCSTWMNFLGVPCSTPPAAPLRPQCHAQHAGACTQRRRCIQAMSQVVMLAMSVAMLVHQHS